MFCQLNYRSLSVIRYMSESTGAKLYGHSAIFLRSEKFFVENCVILVLRKLIAWNLRIFAT